MSDDQTQEKITGSDFQGQLSQNKGYLSQEGGGKRFSPLYFQTAMGIIADGIGDWDIYLAIMFPAAVGILLAADLRFPLLVFSLYDGLL